MPGGFVAVHVGAGQYSETALTRYRHMCGDACREAVAALRRSDDAMEACVAATMVLENCPFTNAGIGSSLSAAGTVECDAAIMESKRALFGSVGALSCVQNPIHVAAVLAKQDYKLNMEKLVCPVTLAGEGALSFAREQQIPTVDRNALVTKRSLQAFHKAKTMLQEPSTSLDTVGVVCTDSQGHVAAACSSGGIILKRPGRLGSGAIFGAGCFADENKDTAVAVTSSGCGECLIQTQFSRSLCMRVLDRPCDATEYDTAPLINCVSKFSEQEFLKSRYLQNVAQHNRVFGSLILAIEMDSKSGELIWAHNSQSFGVGYMSRTAKKPCAFVSSASKQENTVQCPTMLSSVPVKLI